MKIQVDTREKKGKWTFSSYANVQTVTQKVDYGDYMLVDYPLGITIDRKKTLSEVTLNVKEKRFRKELEAMSVFEEAYIICEFPYRYYDIFPEKSGVPKSKWKYLKISGSWIREKVQQLELEYGVPFIYCDGKYEAEEKAFKLFQEYLKKQE